MLIKMLETLSTTKDVYVAGKNYDVDEAEAKCWIKGKIAVEFKSDGKEAMDRPTANAAFVKPENMPQEAGDTIMAACYDTQPHPQRAEPVIKPVNRNTQKLPPKVVEVIDERTLRVHPKIVVAQNDGKVATVGNPEVAKKVIEPNDPTKLDVKKIVEETKKKK